MATRDEENISQLTCMGFPVEEAINALQKTDGNLERAVDRLLSGEGSSIGNSANDNFKPSVGAISLFSNDTDSIVRGSTSQYSYGSDGRSACTCISLTAAEIVANTNARNGSDETTIMTTEFLDRSIEVGVSRYIKIRNILASSSSLGTNDVEHLSADEVLRKDDERANSGNFGDNNASHKRLFDIELSTIGGDHSVRQGALSRDPDHPLGMKSVLQGLVNDIREERRERNRKNARGSDGDGCSKLSNIDELPMICILVTKSPETVLLCLPPADHEHNTASNANKGLAAQKQKYWLIDSHPRPQLLPGVETSHAKPHNTIESLLGSLRDIFPFTDLGPEIPSIMSDMYNMFDMYPLEGRKHSTDN